jgi:hypothetical protein
MINSDAQGTVARHHTRVEICEGKHVLDRFDLDGHTVSIDGAPTATVTYDDHYRCAVPHLLREGFAQSMTLSPRVTESPVADRDARELFREFHRELAAGASPAEALRRARAGTMGRSAAWRSVVLFTRRIPAGGNHG